MFKNYVIGRYREPEHFRCSMFRNSAVPSLGKALVLHEGDFSGRIRLLFEGQARHCARRR